MKSFISVLSLVFVLSFPIGAQASDRSELLAAFAATFGNDFEADGSSTVTVTVDDRQVVTAESVIEYINRNQDWESHTDFTLDFNTSLLATVFPEPIPALAGVMTFGSDGYYEFATKTVWSRIRDLDLQISEDGSDLNIKDMAEGYFELTKFFSDKYIMIDFADAIASMTGDEPAIVMLRTQLEASLAVYDDYGTFATEMLRIALDSGLFALSKSNSQYLITLTQDPNTIRLEAFAELLEILGFAEAEVEAARAELGAANAELVATWPEVLARVDLSVRFNTSPLKITLINSSLTIADDYEVTEFDPETWESEVVDTVPIAFTANGILMVSDTPGRVAFPTDGLLIDFTKFLKAIAATLRLQETFTPIEGSTAPPEFDFDEVSVL